MPVNPHRPAAAPSRGAWIARWLPVVLWAALIFLISANPQPYSLLPANGSPAQQSRSNERLGRILHTLEYGVLAALTLRALRLQSAAWGSKPSPGLAVLAWAGCVVYGVSDEVHQVFVPGRAFQLGDLALDALGALAGVILAWLITRRRGAGGVRAASSFIRGEDS